MQVAARRSVQIEWYPSKTPAPSCLATLVKNQVERDELQYHGFLPEFILFFKNCTLEELQTVQIELAQYKKTRSLKDVVDALQEALTAAMELIQKLEAAHSEDDFPDIFIKQFEGKIETLYVLELAQARYTAHAWFNTFVDRLKLVFQDLREARTDSYFQLYEELVTENKSDFAEFILSALEYSMSRFAWSTVFCDIDLYHRYVESTYYSVQKRDLIQLEQTAREWYSEQPELARPIFSTTKAKCAGQQELLEVLEKVEVLRLESDGKFVTRALDAKMPLETITLTLPYDAKLMMAYRAISDVAISNHFERPTGQRLTAHDCMRLAVFFVETMQPVTAVVRRYFSRRETKQARDLHFDWEHREVYLIAHSDYSTLKACGSYKKVRSCAAISFDDPENCVVHAAHITLREDPVAPISIRDIERDLPFLTRLQRVTGIPKVRSYVHIHAATGTPINVSMVMDRAASGTLGSRANRGDLCIPPGGAPGVALCHITRQILTVCADLQRRSIIHADLKLANFLVGVEDQIMLTDFGFAYFLDPPQGANSIQMDSMLSAMNPCASWWYTPPEFLESGEKRYVLPRDLQAYPHEKESQTHMRRSWIRFQHFQMESFVIGSILYDLSYGILNWQRVLHEDQYWPPREKISPEFLAQIRDEYKKSILDELQRLKAIDPKNRTAAEHHKYAILKMMDERSKRWTVEEAKSYWEQYLLV